MGPRPRAGQPSRLPHSWRSPVQIICLQTENGTIWYVKLNLNPFICHKEKMSIYIFRGFLHPWHRDMFSDGNAAHPIGCDSPLQPVMAVWRASNLKNKVRHMRQTNCRSLGRIICRGLEGPRGSKGTLISRPIQDLEFFMEKPMSPQDTGRQ